MNSRKDQLRQECIAFHRAHPEVWRLFVTFTKQAIASNRNHFGVGAIWERLRWETQVNPQYRALGELKLNNNYRAFYARAFATKYPQHADFFRFRRQRSEDEQAA